MNELADAMDSIKHDPSSFQTPSAPGTTYEVVGVVVREIALDGTPTGQLAVRVHGEWA